MHPRKTYGGLILIHVSRKSSAQQNYTNPHNMAQCPINISNLVVPRDHTLPTRSLRVVKAETQ